MVLRSRGARLLGALLAGALLPVSAGLGAGSAWAQARRDVHVSPQEWVVQKSYPPTIEDVAGLLADELRLLGRGNHGLGWWRDRREHDRRQHVDLRSRIRRPAPLSRHFLPDDDPLLGDGIQHRREPRHPDLQSRHGGDNRRRQDLEEATTSERHEHPLGPSRARRPNGAPCRG